MKHKMITVKTTHEYSDIASLTLIECGSEGILVKDRADIEEILSSAGNWDYYDDDIFDGYDETVLVSGFFAEDYAESELYERFAEIKSNGGADISPEISVSIIDSADWDDVWRQYYTPIVLENIAVVPAWVKFETDKKIVRIDPGLAFGTGRHETTRMVLSLLEKLDFDGKTVYDVGCGSGILGIAASVLGAKECVLFDVDSQAIKAANSNAVLNATDGYIILTDGGLTKSDTSGLADIILANITADILIGYRELFLYELKDGGYLILSGIIDDREAEVKAAYLNDGGFEQISEVADGGWRAFHLKKK